MIRVPAIARFALVATLVLGLGGCKTVTHWFGGDKQAKTETLEVAELYAEAKHKLDVEEEI